MYLYPDPTQHPKTWDLAHILKLSLDHHVPASLCPLGVMSWDTALNPDISGFELFHLSLAGLGVMVGSPLSLPLFDPG